MSKHTPGPWKWEGDLIGPDGEAILEIGGGYDGLWGGVSPNDANARLIAAAPELLDELRSAVPILKTYGYNTATMESAIAKAEGRS